MIMDILMKKQKKKKNAWSWCYTHTHTYIEEEMTKDAILYTDFVQNRKPLRP